MSGRKPLEIKVDLKTLSGHKTEDVLYDHSVPRFPNDLKKIRPQTVKYINEQELNQKNY